MVHGQYNGSRCADRCLGKRIGNEHAFVTIYMNWMFLDFLVSSDGKKMSIEDKIRSI